jgi:NDP-sugar pyrophosphorylase family protein
MTTLAGRSAPGTGERVAAYRNKAEWYDIGTSTEYERATQDMAERAGLFG